MARAKALAVAFSASFSVGFFQFAVLFAAAASVRHPCGVYEAGGSSASTRARKNTSRNIARVSRPVFVFCSDG